MKKTKKVLLSLNFHPDLSKYYNLYNKNKIIPKKMILMYMCIFFASETFSTHFKTCCSEAG